MITPNISFHLSGEKNFIPPGIVNGIDNGSGNEQGTL